MADIWWYFIPLSHVTVCINCIIHKGILILLVLRVNIGRLPWKQYLLHNGWLFCSQNKFNRSRNVVKCLLITICPVCVIWVSSRVNYKYDFYIFSMIFTFSLIFIRYANEIIYINLHNVIDKCLISNLVLFLFFYHNN